MSSPTSRRIGRPGLSSKQAYAVVALVGIILLSTLALALKPRSAQLATSQTVTSQSSSSKGQGSLLLALGDKPRILGPMTTLDYTLTFYVHGNVTGPYSLAYSSPNGISLKISPSVVAFAGNQEAADVEVNTSESVVPGDYAVMLTANGSAGSFSTTFHFTVVEHLIVINGPRQTGGDFVPGNLTVKAKSTVTWFSVDLGDDDNYYAFHQVNFKTLNVTSPRLQSFGQWTYTFEQSGTFTYSDLDNPEFEGTIVVTG